MSKRSLLTSSIALNALLSLVLGLVLVLAPSAIGDRLDVDLDGWLRLLGLGLLVHAIMLVVVQRGGQPSAWVWMNLVVITPYPVLMLVLAFTSLVEPNGGKALVIVDGVLVAALAVGQWVGLRRRDSQRVTLPG